MEGARWLAWCASGGGGACGVEAREVSLGSGEEDSERDEPEPEGLRRRPLSVPPPGVLGVLSPPVAPPPPPPAPPPLPRSPLAYHRW